MLGWLAIYCALIMAASILGGWVPLFVRLTHRRMQIAISFVAGVMLGVGLLHLLPHSFFELESIDATVAWVLGGFMLMFFLERFFHFHHHDAPEDVIDDQDLAGHAHAQSAGDAHDPHCEHHEAAQGTPPSHPLAWGGAAIGLTLHTVVEGIALAAAVAAESDELTRWAGLGTFLAIVLHKPFDSLTIGTLMAREGWSAASRHWVNGLYALVVPCGVLLYFAGAGQLGGQYFLGRALGFAAGAFLCIATSDLLPELQFHRHDRGTLSLALLGGISLAIGLLYLEGAAHHDDGHPHEAHAAAHDH